MGRNRWLPLLLAALVLVGCGGPDSADVTVVGKRWERVIPVEERQRRYEESWSAPYGDVEIISAVSRRHGTKTIRYTCGTTTRTDSKGKTTTETKYCTRDEPKYDVFYMYYRWVWVEVRRAVTQGSVEDPPTWPTSPAVGLGERLGTPQERNIVQVRRDPDQYGDLFCAWPVWQDVRVGQRYRVALDWGGNPDPSKGLVLLGGGA